MGKAERGWQDTEAVLDYSGKRRREAILKYEMYVKEGLVYGKRHELTGGGLIPSMGSWGEVLSLRRKGIKVASDDRLLGSSGSPLSWSNDLGSKSDRECRGVTGNREV
jgi:putative transposase